MAEDDSMESDGPLEEKDDDNREEEPVTVPPKKAGRSRKPPPSKPKPKASAKAESATSTPAASKTSANNTSTTTTPPTTTSTTAATDGASPAKKKRGPKSKPHGDGDVKKKRYVMTHPRTLDMITEALDELQDPQGSSVRAIQSWIIANYKTVRPDMMKTMLKRALKQGLADGTVCRPKGQADTKALIGRYKIGKPGSDSDPNTPAPPRTNPRPARNQALVKGLGSTTLKKKGKKKKGTFGKKAKRPVTKSKRK